jgi:hypothetical protein
MACPGALPGLRGPQSRAIQRLLFGSLQQPTPVTRAMKACSTILGRESAVNSPVLASAFRGTPQLQFMRMQYIAQLLGNRHCGNPGGLRSRPECDASEACGPLLTSLGQSIHWGTRTNRPTLWLTVRRKCGDHLWRRNPPM